ncbi:MAG: tail fiber domain-containing protein, partial [Saprospiraceae bacterium]|nr:tail fiber domain-containing protein [Saprospiraceae bacterium]
TVMGHGGSAIGYSSTVLGFNSIASGVVSISMGDGTIARSYGETALGIYNTDYVPNLTGSKNDLDRLFVIGNGTLSTRSDAMIVYKSGNTILNGILTLSNGSDSITFPNTDGTNGQVLTTNGSGTLLWATASSETTATGLEQITEGGNTGWRLYGADSTKYGHIGNNAVDMSYSSSLGTVCGATGWASTATGQNTEASGHYSTAMGISTRATGWASTSMGYQSIASGHWSIATGDSCIASGDYANAGGYQSIASGHYSTATGFSTHATGWASTATGQNTEASGHYSTAMGTYAKSTANHSISIGWSTEATGDHSTAIGRYNWSTGNGSTSLGWGNYASGNTSTAMGYFTVASGGVSTSMGWNTEALGSASTTMGRNTTAESFVETAIGSYNTDYVPFSTTSWNYSDRLFVVGNGQSHGARSDAFVLYKNGNATLSGILTQSSDINLKTNILPLQSSLSNVLELGGYSYHWKDIEKRGADKQIGIIAQEVEALYPELVYKDGNNNLTVNYSGLIPVLIEATKEQQDLIEQQNEKITALENEIKEIKELLNNNNNNNGFSSIPPHDNKK